MPQIVSDRLIYCFCSTWTNGDTAQLEIGQLFKHWRESGDLCSSPCLMLWFCRNVQYECSVWWNKLIRHQGTATCAGSRFNLTGLLLHVRPPPPPLRCPHPHSSQTHKIESAASSTCCRITSEIHDILMPQFPWLDVNTPILLVCSWRCLWSVSAFTSKLTKHFKAAGFHLRSRIRTRYKLVLGFSLHFHIDAFTIQALHLILHLCPVRFRRRDTASDTEWSIVSASDIPRVMFSDGTTTNTEQRLQIFL